MKILSNCVGLMAVFCVVDGAHAALRITTNPNATGRASATDNSRLAINSATAAMRRLPTMISAANVSSSTSSSSSSSSSSLMTKTECVDAYTECIKSNEVCGFDFEECTTSELFYAKKPQCNSVLLQCGSDGINALFGTSNTTYLTIDNVNVYPTQGSILGQFIAAGEINNRLDKASCVKRYTSCLKKENVCGEDFELCTSDTEFRKQKIFCESTLARCTDDGKTELFGQTDTNLAPKADSRLRIMITEGAQLAANNAVSTCYKIASQCFLNACSENPYRCLINSSMNLVAATDALNQTDTGSTADKNNDVVNASSVSRYLRGACEDTIGGNKYCHMTSNKGKVPTPKDLIDEDLRDEVYSDIYSSVMNTPLRDKIQKFANSIDAKAKDKCRATITDCAKRACGGGLGSACYASVFGGKNCFNGNTGNTAPVDADSGSNTVPTRLASDIQCSINGASTYLEIRNGCEAIVNTDQNCLYAVAAINTGAYNYTYNNADAFTTLFPAMESSLSDPIGAVTGLNALLSENYNPAAIEKMGKQCKTTAVSCIRSLCGADFVNCYRNRTDVMADTYATDNAKFNQSMNKVGGVLDFTIVRGLCVNTVKDSDACEEHFKIQQVVRHTGADGKTGWGENQSVRDSWVGAVRDGYNQTDTADTKVLMGCMVRGGGTAGGGLMGRGSNSGSVCDSKAGNPNFVEDCGYVDSDGCIYDQEYYITETDYQFSMTVDTLFQEVMADLELEAQAKYNAKLTAEQHMCIDANNGGLMGNRELSGTYQWVKLKSKRTPKNYSTAGLKVNDFEASNDLYGSFCRARVTIQSDDPDIQSALQTKTQNWSTAYFAVGDVFTCGSWIPQANLEAISTLVACKKAKADGKIDASVDCAKIKNADDLTLTNSQKWGVAGVSILGALGGGAITDVLQTQTGLGGLLGTTSMKSSTERNLMASLNEAEDIYKTVCKEETTGCDEDGGKCFRVTRNTVESFSIKTYYSEPYSNKKTQVGCDDVDNYITNVRNKLDLDTNDKKQYTDGAWKNGLGRGMVDLTGSAVLGTGAGITTAQIMKANNRASFTAAQQEFMNNVGNHIYCFIGADEAGTYGDLIEISID